MTVFRNELYESEQELDKEIDLVKEKYSKLLPFLCSDSRIFYYKQAFMFDKEIYAVGIYASGDINKFGYIEISALCPIKFSYLYDSEPNNFGTLSLNLIFEGQLLKNTRTCNLLIERKIDTIEIKSIVTGETVIVFDSYEEDNNFVSIVGDLSKLDKNDIRAINLLLMELYNSQKCMFVSIDDKWELTLV